MERSNPWWGPWWRRVFQYAWGGVRSGLGLLSRTARTEVGEEEERFLQRSETEQEVESPLSDPSPGFESVPSPVTAEASAAGSRDRAPEQRATAPEPTAETAAEAGIAAKPSAESAESPPGEPEPAAEVEPESGAPAEGMEEPGEASSEEPAPEPAAAEPEVEDAEEVAPHAAAETEPTVSAAEAETTAPAAEPLSASAAANGAGTAGRTRVEEPAGSVAAEPAAPAKRLIKLEAQGEDTSPFSVLVEEVYDGPLDLLLDLIRKQDIDIYDIPIARITAQFLAYVNQLKASDVDVAGEFIYTASLLIHIKSRMLLPRAPAGPEEAAEDPRRELVERLLEHERFKNAAQMLQEKQMLEAATWTNPGFREFQDDIAAEPEMAADTVDLVRVFREILERARNQPVLDVQEEAVTVGQMVQFLARRLTTEDKPIALRRLLSHAHSERALIAMFLALLELVRLQAILLRQDRAFSEIFIKKHSDFDAVMNTGLANAQDDWR